MKKIFFLLAGLSCAAFTGCHSSSHSGGYTHQYYSSYGYNNSYSPQPGSQQYSSITKAQAEGKYDATTTYATGLYPAPAPAPVTQPAPAPASKTDTSAAGGTSATVGTTSSSSSSSSGHWVEIPVGRTVITPKTEVQPKPQPKPESHNVEPQGAVPPTYSTSQGASTENPRNKSGLPYSAYHGNDQHWYDDNQYR